MPETIVIPAPSFINVHLTNPQAMMDGAGVIFAATRQNSKSGGGIVWRVVNDTPEIVLNPGIDDAYGNGELVVWTDGYARYITVTKAGKLIAYVVPKWVPV